ncbi:MAG: hypothetical protein HY822_15640 [Acidobacteria bacterium]|nr:hypothetical protein [Acidobacteriota bacterium]
MRTRIARRVAAIILFGAAIEVPLAAYADPGAGAMLWQMLAAGFVGSLFYLRRLTDWFERRRRGPKG